MSTNARDARRRRIAERGSDRLALITGRIQSLSSSSSQPQHSYSASLSSMSFQEQDQQSDQPIGTREDANGTIDSVARAEPQLRKCETQVDPIRMPPLDTSAPPTIPKPFNSPVPKPRPPAAAAASASHPRQNKFFTANEVSASISATENTRIACSVAIALLVVVAHLSIPLLSYIVRSIIAPRPLFLVLLTDVTVVLGRVLYGKQKHGPKKIEQGADDADEEWAGVGQALETGLLLYKAIGAAFMDCSIYAVVVICCLSLL